MHQEIMEDKEKRIHLKVFNQMAKWMRTRTSDQCRSHHQKLLQYHQSIRNIITHFEEVIFRKMQAHPRTHKVKAVKIEQPDSGISKQEKERPFS